MSGERYENGLHGRRFWLSASAAMVIGTLLAQATWAAEFPGPSPGTAKARLDGGRLELENEVMAAVWNLGGDRLGLVEVEDRLKGCAYRLEPAEAFGVELGEGGVMPASRLEMAGEPSLERIAAEPNAAQRARRFPGWKATAAYVSPGGSMRVRWEIVFRDRSNYVQQRLVVQANEAPLQIRKVRVCDVVLPAPRVCGEGVGSPVAAGDLFFAGEHPMADNRVIENRIICEIPRYAELRPKQAWEVNSVVGVVPEGQLRRGFLYYLERERARPYRPLFYYISWFDIAYHDRKMDEGQCLRAIEEFARETAVKRGVKPDAFVFDDGWDDNETLWQFHDGFPNGFTPLREAAAKYGAFLGTWISPWGGYSKAKAARLRYGEEQGFETAHGGFSLAGPTYFARFRDVCAEHAENYGVRYFKFDGIGEGSSAAGPGAEFGPDIEAMLRLIAELRARQPDLFFNTTVGTWPSPYWLFSSDSIWRGGGDLEYHGAGTSRQQWITYRDATAYRVRVRRAPLYPLNSLKSQGVMCAQLGLAAELSRGVDDLVDDIRMAAASGTQVQEFFVTPSMMPAEAWDATAEAMAWVRENTDVLVDTHWVGGDPGEGEVYGYASWSPRKGILALRNPSAQGATFEVELKGVFELPDGSPARYRVKPLWQRGTHVEAVFGVGRPHQLELSPFEVVVFEAWPEP